ncbi:MAG: copper resistance protein CopC [Microbacteriaceae bacterium]
MKIYRPLSALLAAFAFSAVVAAPSFAHAALTGTAPEEGAEATDVTSISLTANEELLDLGDGEGFVLAVSDADHHFYGDGCVSVDGATASMPVVLGDAGEYTVAYRVVSADGHPIEGSWRFTYSPAPDAVAGDAFVSMPVCGETPAPVETPGEEPTDVPTMMPTATGDDAEFDVTPFIGIATIPIIIAAIWLLMRSLGKRDSEDHLN